ncbi:DUF5979 domain-containing protein [Propionicimonas paludicola]|uniref:DUF5979 domain-containing protein n=1 Tax=Propionicimonas paludicola TaxID=185243 RepID=UPI001179B24A|nr:DUF5979 domain-containing protein [Propionicimonas paludicola]
MTATFSNGGLAAGQLVAITIKAVLPADTSANLDGSTVNADLQVTADNTDPVRDTTAVKLSIPPVLRVTTSKVVSPTALQPALPGRPVRYTLTAANTSNVSVDTVQLAEPADPAQATPFDVLELTGIESLQPPSDADRVQLDWFDGTTWHAGTATPIPSDPGTLLPSGGLADITGLRISFTTHGSLVAPGSSGRVVLATKTRGTAFTGLADGASLTVANQAAATVSYAGTSKTATDSASLTFKKSPVSVQISKQIAAAELVSGDSTTVNLTATNGLVPVHTLRIDEPAAATDPDLIAQGLTFSGFVTGAGSEAGWPAGATSAEVTYRYADDTTQTLTSTTPDTLPSPAEGAVVRSFSVVFTAPGDGIDSHSAAVVVFRVKAGQVTQEAQVRNTAAAVASTEDTSLPTSHATETTSDQVTMLPQRVAASASKRFSRASLWAAPGSTMTVELGGEVAPSSTVGSTRLSLTDQTPEFWRRFDLRRIVSTDIPAGSTLKVEYLDAESGTWTTLASQAGPKSGWSFAPSSASVEPEAIAGLRFTFTATNGELLPVGYTVAPRFEVMLRSTLRDDPQTSTDPSEDLEVTNVSTVEVENPEAAQSTESATSPTATVTLHSSTNGGGSGAPDLVSKSWLTTSTIDALSQDLRTTRLSWDTDALRMSRMIITDDPRGAENLAGSSYDAFDLVRIQPITRSLDPLIAEDRVSAVELYYEGAWHSVTDRACPTSSACDGTFPGYTLSADEQAKTQSMRLTFSPGSANTSGALAIGSGSTPSRRIQLDMRLRNTLRSDPSQYVLGTSHPYTYNSGDPGVVDNQVTATGELSVPTKNGVESYTDEASAAVTIYDRPLNVSLSKSFDQDLLGLPQLASTDQSQYPLITSTLTATNTTASLVPELTLADPNPHLGDWGAYNYLNLYQLRGGELPADLERGQVSVDLQHWDGTAISAQDGLSLDQAEAMTPAELADVVGVTVHYGHLESLREPSAKLIDTGSVATVQLTYQLRARLRTSNEPVGPIAAVTNTAIATIVSPGGTNANTPEATASAKFAIAQPTYAVAAGKTITPANRYEDESNEYTVALSGRPSGTARTTLLTLTDDTATFWNAFDLSSIPAVEVPAPVNQLQLSVLTGIEWSYDAAGNVLGYQCAGSTDLSACWHSGDWTSASSGKVTLSLPSGISAGDVRGVRIGARSVDANQQVVQWERPASPRVQVNLNVTRRASLVYGNDGGSTTAVPTTRPGLMTAPGESVQGQITNRVVAQATAGWLETDAPYAASATSTSTTLLRHRVNQISIEKTPGRPSADAPVRGFDLGEPIPFKLKITNTGQWNITGLRLLDQVGTVELDHGVSSSALQASTAAEPFTFTVDGLAVPGFAASLDTDTGKLQITVPEGFILRPGAVLLITANLKFRDYLQAGTIVSNTATVISDRRFETCQYTVDGLAQEETSDVEGCTSSTQVRAAASTPMTVTKSVKGVAAGDPDATQANVDDLGVISTGSSTALADCDQPDDGYYAAPCVPITRPGGTERWRLSMINGGNVLANTISALDVLPAVGDTGVTIGTSRKSKFRPLFAGNVRVSLDGSGYRVATYYSTTAGSPSCNKSDILNDTNPDHAANCGIAWTRFENADFADPTGADHARAASVKAIKVVISYDDPQVGVAPGGAVQVTFDTITPAHTALTDPTTVEPIAWNSVAVGSRTAEVSATADTPAYPARASLITEPRKVGVAIASGKLNLAKTVTVPDGSAWTAALPNSYSGTLTCSDDAGPLTLSDPAAGSLSLPVPGRTGTGTTVGYNLDGSSNLPLFASCRFDEDSAQGATSSATSVIATNSYADIANVSNGWAGPALPTLAVTNTYRDAGFSVTKTVTGPVARDAAGQPVSFKDFGYTASCTLNGTEVLPAVQRSFTLRDGGTMTFEHLPAGATCAVTEQDVRSATDTTVEVTGGSRPETDGATARFSLVAGDAEATVVDYTNHFSVGAVELTKVAVDPTGLWDDEAFAAQLTCTHPDAVPETVFDGEISLDKSAPVSVTNLPTGASCTVTEAKVGGANSSAIVGGSFVVGDDPSDPAKVTITNTFTTGSVKVTKTITANGAPTSAEPWVSGEFPVTLSCTRQVNGESVPVDVPHNATRTLTKAGGFTTTYTDLPTGATCSATEDGAGSVPGQPDPTVTVTDPVSVGNATTAAIGITNDFRAGKLQIHKTLSGVGAGFFSSAKFGVSCTLDGTTVFTASNVAVTTPSLASSVIGPLPFGASCQVTETATGGADATPGANTVVITKDDAASDVNSTSFENYFSAGTVTVSKVLTGDAAGASWATGATFGLAVKCGKTATGPYSYDGTVQVKGGQSVQLTDGNGQAILFPYGTHCWASETTTNGAVDASVDKADFDHAAQVLASPEAVQNLGITATNAFSYAGFTVTKDVVTSGAKDQAGAYLTYKPTFTFATSCTFNGSTVLSDTFTLSGSTSSETGTTRWGEKTYDHLPTGASCTVTETDTGAATSTGIVVKRAGQSNATVSGATSTFTLVKGDPSNATGDPAANVAAITNTYGVGAVTLTKALDISNAGLLSAAKAWAYQPFTLRLTCTSAVAQTGAASSTVYDGTVTLGWSTSELSGLSSSTNKKSSTISQLPSGASCSVSETVDGGANTTTYTNQKPTVGDGTTATSTVTNTFTQGMAKVQKLTRAGTTTTSSDVAGKLPWSSTKFDVTLTCTRDIGGSTETITKSGTITGASSLSWSIPTQADCTVAETGVTYPTGTPTQPPYTVVVPSSPTSISGTGTYTLNVTNYFGYGNLKVSKSVDGDGATRWGGGTFTFGVTCTLPLNGTPTTVFSKSDVTAKRANTESTFASAVVGPVPVGSACTVTETNAAGAIHTTPASVSLDPIDNVLDGGSTKTAAFTNTFSLTGFTVTKTVDNGGAKDTNGLGVKYTPSYGFSASCTYNNGLTSTATALATSTFSLKDGESKTFTDLPAGANCTVSETNAANAASTDWTITKNQTVSDSATGSTSTRSFTLVRATGDLNDPGANVAAFTNRYTTGKLNITKTTDGAGKGTWDGGTFTLRAVCTLAGATDNAGNATILDVTKQLTAGQSWLIEDLPNRASCVITEPKSAGANQQSFTVGSTTTSSQGTALIGNGTTGQVAVSNTFHTGTVRVQKSLVVEGGNTTAEPWASTGFPMTLACTKDLNDDGIAESIPVTDATKTIVGAGHVEWSGLPEGASCAATEGTVQYPTDTPDQPQLSSTSYSDPVVVGNAETRTQTVTNEFGYGHVQITKKLAGEAAAAWGGAPYSFDVTCTLAGSQGNVFEAKDVTLQRSGDQTEFSSALLGPIPQGAICTVTETDKGWATTSSAQAGPDLQSSGSSVDGSWATLKPVEADATRTAVIVNDFTFSGFSVTKLVTSDAVDAAGQPIAYTGSYAFTASCTIGGTEFLTPEQRSFTLAANGTKEFGELPTGAECTVRETDARGAAGTAVRTVQDEDSVDTGTTSTDFTLVHRADTASASAVTFTNRYTTGGLDITKATQGDGKTAWGTGKFTVRAQCTFDADADASSPEVTVFDDTRSLSAGQNWELRNLPTGAHCAISEAKNGGANATTIDLPNPTIGTGNQVVTVTNTFNTGSVKLTKAITANGTNAAGLAPWSTGSFPVTLTCTKDLNNDGVAEDLDLDARLGAGFAAKTITGAGHVQWDGLPQGASCTVVEGTSSVTDQPQPTASVGSATVGDGTVAQLNLTNAFAAGKLVIHKEITGAANTTWGTGPFRFDVSCTQDGFGSVFSATGITLTPTAGQTSLDSAPLGPIPFGSTCAVTESSAAGATDTTSPDHLTITENAETANVTTASFTNQFDYAGFTVTKQVSSSAKNAAGAAITYKAAAFTASCTFKGAEVLSNAADRSFTLAAGASRTFSNLPTGAQCTVAETNSRSAAGTDVRFQSGSTDTTSAATTKAFTLVSGDATATRLTFTNKYTTGSVKITKSVAGSGAALWGTGTFTANLTCTLADASSSTVYSATQDLAAGQSWTVPDLVSSASCTVSEPKTGGGNSKTISPTTFTVGTSEQAVSLTNTFTLGAVTVAKALTVNGTSTTASPWTSGSYQVKLACTRPYNGSSVAIDIPGDSFPLGDSQDGVRTISGNGQARYDNLPTGASCSATEVSSSPTAQSTSISAGVTVGNNPSTPQSITVTNDFHTRTMTIRKQLEGAGQASFGDGPFRFDVSCTMPVAGTSTTVFEQSGISLRRTSATDTVLNSAAIGPIPVGAACQVSEVDSGKADFTPDPVTITIDDTASANVAGLTNQFSAGTVYLSKALSGAAAAEPWATEAEFGVQVSCEALIGDARTPVFSRQLTIRGGQRVNVTDADGAPSRVPLGSHCWATETDSKSATSSAVDRHDWDTAAVVTAGTPQTLQSLDLSVTNSFEYAGFTVTNTVDNGGAKDPEKDVAHTGTFDYTARCELNGTTVWSSTFSLTHQANGEWTSRSFTGLPAGASCTLTQVGSAGAAGTAVTVTQDGGTPTSAKSTETTVTLVRGSGMFGADDPAVNRVDFTNSYRTGSLEVTKLLAGAGADAWGTTEFSVDVRCTADLDADPETDPQPVFQASNTLSKDSPVWLIDKLVAGSSCRLTETAWGGATSHPEPQTVTIAADSTTRASITNTFAAGTVRVSKAFTVDGSAPGDDWATQLDAAQATVILSCTRQVNGEDVELEVPGGAERTLNADNQFRADYTGLPTGASCEVTETASSPAANGVGFSPAARTTVPSSGVTEVTVTNDYHTGSLTITKALAGPGAAYGKGPFTFAASCTLPGLDEPVYTNDKISLTDEHPTSATLGPIPVGATCQVRETDAGGATEPADPAEVTIPDRPDSGNAASLTMTNVFAVGSLTITKTVDAGDARDANGLPISYPGGYGFTASCTYRDQGNLLAPADRSFGLANGETRTFSGLPLGAQCTVQESAPGRNSVVQVAVGTAEPTSSDTAEAGISATPGSLEFIDRYGSGAATITKRLTGDGATAWGNQTFILHTRCTLDTDQDDDTAPAVVYDGTDEVSKAEPVWQLSRLAGGADCTVTETGTGGATTAAEPATFRVSTGTATPTAISMVNDFQLGSVRVSKAIMVDGTSSSAQPYAGGDYRVALSCTRIVNGDSVAIDIPGGSERTITGSGSATYTGLPAGASCSVREVASDFALPAGQVEISQPDPVPAGDVAQARVTNDFHTGLLTITKKLTGEGAPDWANADSVFSVSCSLTDAEDHAHSVFSADKITLSRDTSLVSDPLGPIPVGADCTVTETGTGGASQPAAAASIRIADTDENAVTMTNEFGLGSITAAVEVQLDGVPTTATPFASAKFTAQLSCERLVNGTWTPISVPGGNTVELTGADSFTFTGLPLGARCSLEQTDASLTPQALSYRTADTATAGPVSVGATPATITAIDDYHTRPLVVQKSVTGDGASDFATYPFGFSVSCTLDERGVDEPWLVYRNDQLSLSTATGLTSSELGPIPVGAHCTVSESATGGATQAGEPANLTIAATGANTAQLTNDFATGSVRVTKHLLVDGQPSRSEPFVSGTYTVRLSCSQQVDGQTKTVAIPGGDTRTITGDGTAEFAAVPRGASCAISESASSLAVASDEIGIDQPTFTVGADPVEVNVTNAFHTSSLRLVADFTGVGAGRFAKPITAQVDCTLAGASGSVFSTTVTITPVPGQSSASSPVLGPIPVGAHCTVRPLSAEGANALPSSVEVTGEQGTVAVAGIAAEYSAGELTVTKKLTGPGAVAARGKTFTMQVTCQREGTTVAEGALKITGAGSATLNDAEGNPVLLPAGTQCWARETDRGGAITVRIDHDSPATAVSVTADSPNTMQQLAVSVTNEFAGSGLAYTGNSIGWWVPAAGLLSIGLGSLLIRRRRRA